MVSYVASAARRGYVLELCGTAANPDVAVYVHGFLTPPRNACGARTRPSTASAPTSSDGVFSRASWRDGKKLAAGERESRREGLRTNLVRRGDAARDAYLRTRYPRV